LIPTSLNMSRPSLTEISSMSQTTAKRPRIPPEEAFWQRYSPHHEFPLSTISSFALHVLIIGLAALLAWALVKFGLTEDTRPIPAEVGFLDEPPGGGGGNPEGVGTGPGIGAGSDQVPDAPLPDVDHPVDVGPVPREQLVEARQAAVQLPEFKDSGVEDLLTVAGQNVDRILKLPARTRSKLRDGLAAGKGGGGPGSGGGTGSGVGTGTGDAEGAGRGSEQRERRVLRWTMIFNTQNGDDYARQLHALGAILAVPDPRSPDQYLVIRDLRSRPVNPQPEDLAQIKRIYWIDDKPASVRSLSGALGLNPVPERIVAFFPVELERDLLNLELKYRNKKEHEIVETRFEVRRSGATYVPVVVSQR
jgi:hypothetical protein